MANIKKTWGNHRFCYKNFKSILFAIILFSVLFLSISSKVYAQVRKNIVSNLEDGIYTRGILPHWVGDLLDEYKLRGWLKHKGGISPEASSHLKSARAFELLGILKNIDSGAIEGQAILYTDLKNLSMLILELKDEIMTIFPDYRPFLLKMARDFSEKLKNHHGIIAQIESKAMEPAQSPISSAPGDDILAIESILKGRNATKTTVLTSEISGKNTDQLLKEAISQFYRGEYAQAAYSVSTAKKIEPKRPEVLFWSGRLACKSGLWEKGIQDFEDLLYENGQYFDMSSWGASDYGTILAEGEELVAKLPESIGARYWLGSLYLNLGNRNGARDSLLKAMELMN